MIVLTLGGGLGNQMFQYAFVRTLQEKTGDRVLKFSGYHLANTGNSERMLFNLNIQDGITFCSEDEQRQVEAVQEGLLRRIRYYKRISRRIPGFSERMIGRMAQKGFYTTDDVYKEQRYSFRERDVYYVEGGFQTWTYWRDRMPQIREELLVKTEASPQNRALAEEMADCESVCVHIRRGDYLAPEFAHLNICDEAYYREAMEQMKRRKPEAVFYIFTNNHREVEWIREHYDFVGFTVRYVDLDNPDYEELRLMYSCRNFIISNSTYSWWGQFLCGNPDKIVMAPSIWNRQADAAGIYMPDWQIIEVK